MSLFKVAVCSIVMSIASLHANAAGGPVKLKFQRDFEFQETIVDISNVYIPSGFDAESDAFVVASGVYPNGCYRWKDAKVDNVTPFQHNITSVAHVSQGMCIMVLVPFSKEIRIGKMATGKHMLRFLAGDGTYFEKEMIVE